MNAKRVATAVWSGALFVLLSQALPAKAGYPDGCAGSADLGRSDFVGVPDIGYMAAGTATAPKEMVVYHIPAVIDDYTVMRYYDGEGLVAPSDSAPLWLAPTDGPGAYVIIEDGEVCIVSVTADASPMATDSPTPSSAPGAAQADEDTIRVPMSVAYTGLGALVLFVLVVLVIYRRRT